MVPNAYPQVAPRSRSLSFEKRFWLIDNSPSRILGLPTFIGHDLLLDRAVWIRRINASRDKRSIQRVIDFGTLPSSNAVKLLDAMEDGNDLVLVSEHVDAMPLNDWLFETSVTAMDLKVVVTQIDDWLSVWQQTHDTGVRLTAANILIMRTSAGTPVCKIHGGLVVTVQKSNLIFNDLIKSIKEAFYSKSQAETGSENADLDQLVRSNDYSHHEVPE